MEKETSNCCTYFGNLLSGKHHVTLIKVRLKLRIFNTRRQMKAYFGLAILLDLNIFSKCLLIKRDHTICILRIYIQCSAARVQLPNFFKATISI